MLKSAQYAKAIPGRGRTKKSNISQDHLVEQKVRMVQSILANKGQKAHGVKYGARPAASTKLKTPTPETSQGRWPNESLSSTPETRPTPWVPPWAGSRGHGSSDKGGHQVQAELPEASRRK